MADHAFLMKIGTLLMTDNDVNISFGGDTYLADDNLMEVQEVSETHATIPRVGFSVICEENSAQYLLFNDDPGPIEGEIYYVENNGGTWEKRWEFKGILSRGSMSNYLYSGILEHIISWKMRTRKPLLWDNSTQQARHSGDLGLEYVHEIEDIRQQITWKGSDA